jgi:hypothetical protein
MSCSINESKILEINPHHPLIKDLLCRIKDSKDGKATVVCYENFLNEIV